MRRFTTFETQLGESVVLTDKAKLSLYKKSQNSGYSVDILEEVYRRGYHCWTESFGGNPDSFAFDRVNSFIAGGFAEMLDEDLLDEKRGLWDNIHAKRARIKAGSGERMRKPGSKGAPTDAALKASQNEAADPCWTGYKQIGMKKKNGKSVPNCVPVKEEELNKSVMTPAQLADKHGVSVESINKALKRGIEVEKEHTTHAADARRIALAHLGEKPDYYKKLDKAGLEEDAEAHSKDFTKPSSRFIGSDELTDIYKKQTPGQIIKRVVREAALDAAHGAAPQASGLRQTTRLGRTAPTFQQSNIAPQGLPKVGQDRYSASSRANLSGRRVMTSGSTQATAKTLTPQRVSANQPAPKTAAPTSAPKPTASFGSSTRPTTVSATSSGVGKSAGVNLTSGMSDAGKAKVKPTAPVQIPASAGKAASVLGKALKVAGPVGAVAGLVADAKPLNKGEDELARQKSLGITKPNVTPGMGSTKNIEPVKGGAITTKAPDYYKGKVGDYTVKAGDTLSGIASKTGQSVADLASKNKFDSENKIAAGSKLFTGAVPTPPSRPETESGKVMKKIKEAVLEDWQDKKYKSPSGGLTKAGVMAFRREHPGSKLQTAVTTEPSKLKPGSKAANRRKSFCARMGGMKKRLTSAKTANDPDSRINKALRKWNCEETIHELSVPAGTTGKRETVSTPMVAVRMASGKIEKHPPGKSGSSGGGDE